MRKVFSFVVSLISVALAYANDGAFYAEGNHLIPIAETDIRVQKEVLTLNRVDDRIEVTVYYEFFNPVGEKEVLVGFEAKEPDVNFNKESVKAFPEHPYMRNFKVVMNGEPLTYEVAHISRYDENYKYIINPQYYVDGKIQSTSVEELELDYWMNGVEDYQEAVSHPLYVYHFNARFRPGLNIIQHTYDFDMSDERNGFTKEFFYILTAANRWANHQIDDFTLYVDMGDHTSFHISPTFFKSLDEWEILGSGKKVTGSVPYQMKPDSLFFHIQQGNIRFRKMNFHPNGELQITQDLPFGYWYWFVDKNVDRTSSYIPESHSDLDFFVNFFKEQYLPIASYTGIDKNETYYDLFSQEQRRILKNLPFAYRGYIFNSKELQDFYESTSWYIPNPAYKPDMQQLPEEEQRWVEFWSPTDLSTLSKDVEKRVNDIYNHVFTEYLKSDNPPSRNFDLQYFSKDFYHLHRQIGSIEEQIQEPIVHDVDYWIWGQDWGDDLSFQVLSVEMVNEKKAEVSINIHNCGHDSKNKLVLTYERDNWFIDDMIGTSSWREGIIKSLEDCKKDGLLPSIK